MIRTLLLLAVRVRRAFAWCRAVIALTGDGLPRATEAGQQGGCLYAADTSPKGFPNMTTPAGWGAAGDPGGA